jgi:hypothetical protein
MVAIPMQALFQPVRLAQRRTLAREMFLEHMNQMALLQDVGAQFFAPPLRIVRDFCEVRRTGLTLSG